MQFEILNPHDYYTIDAPDFVTALAAIAIIGEGAYGIDGNGYRAPPVPFGPDFPPDVYKAAGVDGIADLMDTERGRLNVDPQFNEAVAAACASVKATGPRSSTVDLERIGRLNSEALRRRRPFSSIKAAV